MMTNEHNYDDSVKHHVQEELTSRDKEYAAEYLNETDETRERAIMEIRRWNKDELHIQNDDFLILRFLRVCKFDFEKTKTRIRNYYKLQSDEPEWFTNKDPFQRELQELLNIGVFLPLRKPDSKGRLVIILRTTRHDPKIHKISDMIKISVMLVEQVMKDHTIAATASIYGCTLLSDLSDASIYYMFQFGPSILKKIAHTWQNCYPMRVQSITAFNLSLFAKIVIKIFKSFLNEKMRNRLHIYDSDILSDGFKDIPANILPVEYGGTDGTIQELIEHWKKLIEENRDRFISNEN